jgi:hypothetical protein
MLFGEIEALLEDELRRVGVEVDDEGPLEDAPNPGLLDGLRRESGKKTE